LKLERQRSKNAGIIVFMKIMPNSGTNRFFTGTSLIRPGVRY
jgi:hypothetical protein